MNKDTASIPLQAVHEQFNSPVIIALNCKDKFLSFRSQQLSGKEFQRLFDKDGRITNEHMLRQKIFQGGTDSSIREEVWSYLFGLFPCNSTQKERELMRKQKITRYYALKKKWQTDLMNWYPTLDLTIPHNSIMDENPTHVGKAEKNMTAIDHSKSLIGEDICALEAEIIANRMCFPKELMVESLRFISKDVPRTDRSHPYFKGETPNLLKLRDALMTASLVLPELGYVQGMNDLMARFLIVYDSEPMAFWCFHNYLGVVGKNFLPDGMLKQIRMLQALLEELDPELYSFCQSKEISDLFFCHKWLLLCFQREFSFSDGLKILEILCSHHLELYSPQGIKVREECRRILDLKGLHFSQENRSEFSFDLFVAAAILTLFRDQLFQCCDGTQAFRFVSSLSGKLVLDDVLCQAEKLFFAYCQKSVTDAFLIKPK